MIIWTMVCPQQDTHLTSRPKQQPGIAIHLCSMVSSWTNTQQRLAAGVLQSDEHSMQSVAEAAELPTSVS